MAGSSPASPCCWSSSPSPSLSASALRSVWSHGNHCKQSQDITVMICSRLCKNTRGRSFSGLAAFCLEDPRDQVSQSGWDSFLLLWPGHDIFMATYFQPHSSWDGFIIITVKATNKKPNLAVKIMLQPN